MAATLYGRNPNMHHKIWNIVSHRHILHMQLSQLSQNHPYVSLLSGFVNSYVKPIFFLFMQMSLSKAKTLEIMVKLPTSDSNDDQMQSIPDLETTSSE